MYSFCFRRMINLLFFSGAVKRQRSLLCPLKMLCPSERALFGLLRQVMIGVRAIMVLCRGQACVEVRVSSLV